MPHCRCPFLYPGLMAAGGRGIALVGELVGSPSRRRCWQSGRDGNRSVICTDLQLVALARMLPRKMSIASRLGSR